MHGSARLAFPRAPLRDGPPRDLLRFDPRTVRNDCRRVAVGAIRAAGRGVRRPGHQPGRHRRDTVPEGRAEDLAGPLRHGPRRRGRRAADRTVLPAGSGDGAGADGPLRVRRGDKLLRMPPELPQPSIPRAIAPWRRADVPGTAGEIRKIEGMAWMIGGGTAEIERDTPVRSG